MVAVVLSRHCRYCFQDKAHVFSGQILQDGSKIFRDEKGGRWAGWRCPDCERKRVRQTLSRNKVPLEVVLQKLKSSGYTVKQVRPMLRVEKNGQIFRVSTCLGHIEDGDIQIRIDEKQLEKNDIHVVVFSSLRVLNSKEISQIINK